jgi:hypothetical protein
MRRSLVALAAVAVLGAALVAANATWSDRAEDICAEQAPRGAAFSMSWEWKEAAYVCTYRNVEAKPRRVGVIEALHGDRGPQHTGR